MPAFQQEEQAVWDSYDVFVGLSPVVDRDLVEPKRISSIFHWRTLQRLLSWGSPVMEPKGAFIDSHCHVDRLFNRVKYSGTLSGYLHSRQEAVGGQSGFLGCIANFCDPEVYCDTPRWLRLIADPLIYAAVGLHPKKASEFSQDIHQVILRLLEHPKCVPWGKSGSTTRDATVSIVKPRKPLCDNSLLLQGKQTNQ